MKLLFFIHGLSGGGAERVLATLTNALVQKNHDVCIAYTEMRIDAAYALDPRIEEIHLFKHRMPQTILLRIKARLFMKLVKYSRIRRQVSECKPDVVISFLTHTNNDVIISLIGKKVPLIVSEHSKFSRFYSIRTNLSRYLFYRFASAITVLTSKDLERWRARYPKIYYMPNPLKISYGKDSNEKRNKVIMAAGRVEAWRIKGFDTLIRCWDELQNEFPDWKCWIAGDYSRKDIEELADLVPSGAMEKVKFLGFRDDIRKLMQTSEIFCLTSRVEGFPMVLAEAMDAHCCCVSFDVENGPSEIIEDGKSGLLVANQNMNDLKNKLRLVMSDETLRHQLASQTTISIERFSTDKIVSRWEKLFTNVLKN